MDTTRAIGYEEKLKAHGFGKEMTTRVAQYMSRAIEAANRDYKVSDEEFWMHLLLPTGPKRQTLVERGKLGTVYPSNPYQLLDLQGCNKYLLYGASRILEERDGQPVFATDSLNFFKKFHVEYFSRAVKGKDGQWKAPGPKREYSHVLCQAIKIRNKYAHDSEAVIQNVTLESLKADLTVLEQLTEPAMRSPGWEGELNCVQSYWEETKKQFETQFGAAPIPVDEVLRELFMVEENVTPEQSQAMEQAIQWLRLDCQGGKIYGEDRRKLMDKLRHMPAVAELLGGAACQTPEEAAAQAERASVKPAELRQAPALERPLWKGVPATAAAKLRRAPHVIPPEEGTLSALLNSFVILVDESVFLCKEGRKLVTDHLTPLLMKEHQCLYVDESVVGTLFRQFRGSVPYTALELAEPAMAELDPEQVEQMQQLRQELHQDSKAAIKTLRFMRERWCLKVVASPTDSPYSYENFFCLAQSYPGVRFLMLAQDGRLAEELKQVRGQNVVVCKVNLDGPLLPYKATRQIYEAMLAREPEEPANPAPAVRPVQPTPATQTAPPVPVVQAAWVERSAREKTAAEGVALPLPGERLTARWSDGSQRELLIGKAIGQGGEGVVYETAQRELLAKVYMERDSRRLAKLKYMVEHDPHIPGLCWPLALLYNGRGEWMGFLMARAPGVELDRTSFHPGRDNSSITAQGWTRKSLALVAANIADIFSRMHEQGILMGDVNPRNFVVERDCTVHLVDCDSYQMGPFPCQVGTCVFTPPEIHKKMRELGTDSYSYTRTEDNERYSLAMLLFGIVMLGRAPFESCDQNAKEVTEAIIAGDFPYPYHSGEEDEESRGPGKLSAPVGKWRQMWSNTTYLVKTGFYNTFTGKKRLSAGEWAQIFREYVRQIELGHSSDELEPSTYKDTSGRDDEKNVKLVNLVCQQCKQPFNLGEDVWRRRRSRGEPDLCSTHWGIRQNFQRREQQETCGICGKEFTTTAGEWFQRTNAGKPMICPDCANAKVTCSRCGGSFAEKRERVEELQARGADLLCPDCFEQVFPRAVCESCGQTFRPHQGWLEARRSSGKPIWCRSCAELNKEQGREEET